MSWGLTLQGRLYLCPPACGWLLVLLLPRLSLLLLLLSLLSPLWLLWLGAAELGAGEGGTAARSPAPDPASLASRFGGFLRG